MFTGYLVVRSTDDRGLHGNSVLHYCNDRKEAERRAMNCWSPSGVVSVVAMAVECFGIICSDSSRSEIWDHDLYLRPTINLRQPLGVHLG